MGKKTLFLILSGILVLGSPLSHALAQLQPYTPGAPIISSLGQLIWGIVNAVWIIFTVIVLVCFVMAGVIFLTAQGQPEKIKIAKDAFLWGIAGIVVGIIAFSIIAIVGNIIT